MRYSSIDQCFSSHQDRLEKRPFALLVTFDDNSCIVMDPSSAKIISTIYPPPTATSIQKVQYSMYKQRVYTLLRTGALCIYRILDKETAVLELM